MMSCISHVYDHLWSGGLQVAVKGKPKSYGTPVEKIEPTLTLIMYEDMESEKMIR